MRKKKFLHICLSESWGGLEMAVLRWNQILAENGHYNMNICTPSSPLSRHLKLGAFPLLEWDSAHYFAPDFTWKLRKLLEEKKFDAVVLQNLRDLWIVSPALYKNKETALIGFAQMLLAVKKTDLLHRLVYSRLDRLLTLTDWQQKALEPWLPVPLSKFRTIPNFVDTNKFHPDNRSDDYRYQLGFSKEDFVIGIIGRIDEQKGQLELLKAFAGISNRYTRAHLVIVGEPTLGEVRQEKYFHHLKDQVEKNNLSKKVYFIGFQDETQKITANFDLFVLASHEETFGYVVVEAMASGVPVLGTEAGGVPEILKQGELGYLCQPKDWESLQEKLIHILESKQERDNKKEKALKWAREFYDRQKVYERFIALIDSSHKIK